MELANVTSVTVYQMLMPEDASFLRGQRCDATGAIVIIRENNGDQRGIIKERMTLDPRESNILIRTMVRLEDDRSGR
jgi:hypothetical protein